MLCYRNTLRYSAWLLEGGTIKKSHFQMLKPTPFPLKRLQDWSLPRAKLLGDPRATAYCIARYNKFTSKAKRVQKWKKSYHKK